MSEREFTTSTLMTSDVAAFHKKFTGLGQAVPVGPQELDDELALFRIGFMVEELSEYAQAAGFANISESLDALQDHIKNKARWMVFRASEKGRDLEKQFDALVDLVYVALGTSYEHGFDFDEGWRRVQAANMKKVLAKSADESKRGFRFDVVKPKGWKPPDLSDLVKPHDPA